MTNKDTKPPPLKICVSTSVQSLDEVFWGRAALTEKIWNQVCEPNEEQQFNLHKNQ